MDVAFGNAGWGYILLLLQFVRFSDSLLDIGHAVNHVLPFVDTRDAVDSFTRVDAGDTGFRECCRVRGDMLFRPGVGGSYADMRVGSHGSGGNRDHGDARGQCALSGKLHAGK